MKMRFGIMLAVIIVTLGACSNGPNSKYEDVGDRANISGFGHKYPQPPGESEFVLAPGDAVDIAISKNPEYGGTYGVDVNGGINVPLVGIVKVAGLTSSQIRNKLQILLTPFIRDVAVQVVPARLASKNVYFFTMDLRGAILMGKRPITGDMTLIDFFADSGGIPFTVDDCHIKIIRPDPQNPKTMTINMRDMLVNGYTGANVQLLPDDMVYMPPSFWTRFSTFVYKVTDPMKRISSAFRGYDDLRDFVEDGEFDDRGRRGSF